MIVGVSLTMILLGLSPAIGSFLAGVVLASSAYRHQLEADLAPFKGILLGLFFITVGAGIDLGYLSENPLPIVGYVLALLALKMAVLWPLGGLFGLPRRARLLFTLALAQAGEFGFVLLAFAEASRVLWPSQVQPLLLVIAFSMLATPALFWLHDLLTRGRGQRPADAIDAPGPVIIAGLGRFGQVVNRMLRAQGHPTVVLDNRPEVVDRMRRLGIEAYYGDAERPELLEAAGIVDAAALVIGIDDAGTALRLARHARRRHPNLAIVARARDRHEVYALHAAGASHSVREVFEGAVQAGGLALAALGHEPEDVEAIAQAFRRDDQAMLEELAGLWRAELPDERNPAFLDKEREQHARIAASLSAGEAASSLPEK